ncbi:hypothetical protein QAD02_023163, partial [Eretmocerus hayati]
MKSLMSQIRKDWEKITEKDELDILHHHYNIGRIFCIFWIVYYFGGVLVIAGLPAFPIIFDYLLPLANGSHGRIIIVRSDYLFFPEDEYYYAACFHLSSVILLDMAMVSGQDTMYYMCIMHTRGLFDILSYKLQSKLNIILERTRHSPELDVQGLRNHLKELVIMHNEAMRNCILIEEMYSIGNMVVIFLFLIEMPCLLFISLYVVDLTRALQWTPCSVGSIFYMGFNFWMGQQIIDYSEEVNRAAYFSDWLLLPAKERAYIRLMILRSQRSCELTLGKFVVLSLETYKR